MDAVSAILPRPNAESKEFWDACDRGELRLPRCRPCGKVFYYPRRACPHCGATELEWVACSGRGRIYAHSRVEVSFYGPSWERDLPYHVALVDLDEGPRMLTRLVRSELPVQTNARVRVEFVPVEERRLPFFRVVPES